MRKRTVTKLSTDPAVAIQAENWSEMSLRIPR